MRKGGEQLQAIQPVLMNTFEKIEELFEDHGRIEGVPTGYTELDDLLTGLHGGELAPIAARPSMGKTSIGMNFIENAAIRAGKAAAVLPGNAGRAAGHAHALHGEALGGHAESAPRTAFRRGLAAAQRGHD